MSSMPDRPDPNQLHTHAKELQCPLAEGDEEARERVLASHPKFVGRLAVLMEGWDRNDTSKQKAESKLHELSVP